MERTKGEALLLGASVLGRGTDDVDGIRCCVVIMVGVTRAMGAEVVWMPIGRILAVGVVVTVGLTAAVGAVD